MEHWPSTIKTGTTLFTTALATPAVTMHKRLAMTMVMVPIPQALQLAMILRATKSEWRRTRSGSVAATWTRATAHRPDTTSAWNFFSHLTRWAARQLKAIQDWRPILRSTRGVVRLRKVVRLTHCRLQWRLNRLPAL